MSTRCVRASGLVVTCDGTVRFLHGRQLAPSLFCMHCCLCAAFMEPRPSAELCFLQKVHRMLNQALSSLADGSFRVNLRRLACCIPMSSILQSCKKLRHHVLAPAVMAAQWALFVSTVCSALGADNVHAPAVYIQRRRALRGMGLVHGTEPHANHRLRRDAAARMCLRVMCVGAVRCHASLSYALRRAALLIPSLKLMTLSAK